MHQSSYSAVGFKARRVWH